MTTGFQLRAALFHALTSHWWRHKTQFATLVVGLILATALWTGVQAINAHARASYDQAAQTVSASQRTVIEAANGGLLDQATFAALRRAGLDVAPVVTGILPGLPDVPLTGIDPLSFVAESNAAYQPPSGEAMLAFLTPPGSLHAHADHADALTLALAAWPAAQRPTVVLDEAVPSRTIIGDIATVQRLLGLDGQLTALWLPPGVTAADITLPPSWQESLTISDPVAAVDMTGLTDSFHLNLTAFGLLSFLVGLFIVYSAVGLALEARLPSLRTLRVCGVSRRRLVAFMMAETLLIALLAGTLGVLMGFLIAQLLLPDVATSLRGLYGADVGPDLAPGLGWWITGIGLSMLGAFASAVGTYVRIYRLPLLTRTGSHAWRSAQSRTLLHQRIAGAGLWVLAALIYAFGDGLFAAFLVLAGLLTGSALLLPTLLSVLLSLGGRFARLPVSQWFWADARKQVTGLSLALMALLLALSANIGVGGMVESFRQTFTAFLDERLVTEVYIYAPDADAAADITRWLEEQETVTAVLPQWYTRGSYDGLPLDITGFSDHATFREVWTLLEGTPDTWDQVFGSEAILINEQLARRHGLEVGSAVTLTTEKGQAPFLVAGIFADYGNPKGAIRASLPLVDSWWPSAERRRLGVRVPDSPDGLVAALKTRFDLDEWQVTDQATLKGYSRAVFEKTFAITATLNVLTLGVAGVAMFTSLLTLSNARIADMAPLWSLGLSRGELTRAELMKILMLALFTSLAAIPVGLALCWCLVALVNVEAFGWRLPLYLFPRQWGQLVTLGCLIALVATLYPVLRLNRTPPAQLTKVFANER